MNSHTVMYGKTERRSFSKIPGALEMPNLLSIQLDSYQWFLNEGLREVLEDISPIKDYSGDLILEFIDYYQAYKETCLQLYQTQKDVFLAMEDINTVTGSDVFNY